MEYGWEGDNKYDWERLMVKIKLFWRNMRMIGKGISFEGERWV